MRHVIAGSTLEVELGDEWALASGWEEIAAQESHGVYLNFTPDPAIQLHLRQWPAGVGTRTETDLLRALELASSPLRDATTTRDGDVLMIDALVEMRGPGPDFVVRAFCGAREGIVVNAALVGPAARLALAIASTRRLLATLARDR